MRGATTAYARFYEKLMPYRDRFVIGEFEQVTNDFPDVVRRLNEELGHGTVVLIEVAGPHLPSWKKGPRSVRDGRGPRDTYG